MKKLVIESLNESIFNTKLSRVKKFLSDKADECEEIIEDYEKGQDDEDVNELTYQKAEAQLEIIVQIMDMFDMD